MKFVALDFETANSCRSSICAVGIAKVIDGRIAERRSWLVRPKELRFDRINVSIHGITPAAVKDKPLFGELWPTVRDYFKDNCVIAHNASFDISVLRSALDEYRLPHPHVQYHCSVILAKRTWVGLTNYRLNTLAAHLSISLTHHDAEDDAVAAAEIVLRASRFHSAASLDDLCARTGTRQGLLYTGGWIPPRSR
ncbi:MAG: Exodeoxyribonuclease 10 [Firmicutes bacterium]|nr:Exodeoxyribonuclease 10 [candidate division NPL-UPA2 bacterium]MBT9154114.1 Exodeoxyribonuclease 10 [candidate division NPL-UPA2 bacterium]